MPGKGYLNGWADLALMPLFLVPFLIRAPWLHHRSRVLGFQKVRRTSEARRTLLDVAPRVSTLMLQAGTVLGSRYHIEGVVGRGGFGYVYRAREWLAGETVAVKELVSSFVGDRGVVQRFIQEARTMLQLTHTHIARTHTTFEDRGT